MSTITTFHFTPNDSILATIYFYEYLSIFQSMPQTFSSTKLSTNLILTRSDQENCQLIKKSSIKPTKILYSLPNVTYFMALNYNLVGFLSYKKCNVLDKLVVFSGARESISIPQCFHNVQMVAKCPFNSALKIPQDNR